MLGGIIAGALKGAADAYGDYAKGEVEKQQKIDYQQRILDMTEEKERRIEEFRSDLKIREIPLIRSAEAQAAADNAPVRARGEAAGEDAKLTEEARLGLPQRRADSDMAAYNAGKPKRDAEADEKIERAITDVKTRAGDPDYVKGVTDLDTAQAAGETQVAKVRGETALAAAGIRAAGGGGGSGGGRAPTVRRVVEGPSGSMVAVMSDGSERQLNVKSADWNKAVASNIAKIEKDDARFKKLPEAEKRRLVEQRLSGMPAEPAPSQGAAGSSGSAPSRPPLKDFFK